MQKDSSVYFENCFKLRIRIAEKILNINKYIYLALSERRERADKISHLFDRKVFLTDLFGKTMSVQSKYEHYASPAIEKGNKNGGKDEIKILLEKILKLDKEIENLLFETKDLVSNGMRLLKKVDAAVKAYTANDL